MKLVVGLGNPGKEYENTRHNVGFMILDSFVSGFKEDTKFQALIKKDNNVLYAKPITYMNLSGNAVSKIASYYHIDSRDILIVQDDMDLEMGTFRIRAHGSSGGHNGIKSIISSLGTDTFARLRIGISKSNGDTIDYVLGKFSKQDQEKLKDNMLLYQEIIQSFLLNGVDDVMNKYNGL